MPKLNPIQEIALFLSVYALLAINFNIEQTEDTWNTNLLWHLGATLGFALILFKILSVLTKKKKLLSNTITSGLILFLVLHPPVQTINVNDVATLKPLLYPLLATFFVMAGKFLIQWKGGPIFNPVVGGLLGLVIVSKLVPGWEDPFISWWGVSFQGYLSLGLMVFWLLWGLRKWRKYPIVLSFLAVYLFLLVALGVESETLDFIFKDATIYFFAGIMLVEPKTSPLTRGKQLVYGTAAAVMMTLFTVYGYPYFDLVAIATANVLNAGLKIRL